MVVDHRLAAIEFLEHRPERGVAEVFAGVTRHQAKAVGFQRVERVGDFLEATLGIGQRQRGENAEARRVISHHVGGVIIRFARQPAAQRNIARSLLSGGTDVEKWAAGRSEALERTRAFLNTLESSGELSIAKLMLASSQIQNLA